jgi:ABC-type transporter Mla subunit MlaD
VANFTQRFDDTVRQQLAHALDATERTIKETHELSSTERAQIREVVREIRAEVSESSPNVPRLQGLLIGAATTIQTLGSAASAYALLKAAAALIGVHLP